VAGDDNKDKSSTPPAKVDLEHLERGFPALLGPLLPHLPVPGHVDKCALDGVDAVSDMIDTAVYTWASVERCTKAGEDVKCELDVTSAIHSLISMSNIIIKAFHQCHIVRTETPKCGLAAGKLVASAAGIAASAGGISDRCPEAFKPHAMSMGTGVSAFQDKPNVNWHHGHGAICLLDLKDAMKSIIKATTRMMTVKKSCDKSERDCTNNALRIFASFAAIGEYLTGALGHCQQGPISTSVDCGSSIADLLRQLDGVAVAGTSMAKHCTPENDADTSRLFEEDFFDGDPQPGNQIVNIALAALLPLTAMVAFVGGSRTHRLTVEERECELSFVEVPVDPNELI